MTPLLLDISVKATLLLAAAAMIDVLLRRGSSAAARHLTWAITIVALLALPIASVAMPHWAVRIPVPAAIAAPPAPVPDAVPASAPPNWVQTQRSVLHSAPVPTPEVDHSELSTERWSFTGALLLIPLIYVAGVLALLVRLGLEPFALKRLARAGRELTQPEWLSRMDAAARDMGVTSRVRLLQTAREVMPLTFGTRCPTIVLPASANDWTGPRRDAVLLHELAHVARRDCLVQCLAAIASALYWPHPGVWWAARRLRTERELACDDRVLAAGAAAREYAGHLLDLAHTLGSAPAPATALGVARARQLESRLLAVLDAARNRAAVHPRGLTLATAIAIAVVIPLAALRAAVVPRDPYEPVPNRAAEAKSETFRPQSPDLRGTWELRLSHDPGMVQVTVRTEHGTHGRSVALSQLPGITAEQISAASSTVSFPIQREAGTFHVEGLCRRGSCAGTFAFEPRQAFAGELAARGLARPTPEEQMELAIADVGVAFLDELSKNGYAKPDLPDVLRAARHGVNTEYVRGMAALGYRVGTVDALVRLRDHGVDPGYVHGMADSGFGRLSVDELVRARDHGADPEYVKGMRDHGYRIETLDELIRLRDHGIDPSFVRGMADVGFARLTVDELLTARNHGVDPEYVKGMRDHGYRLTLDELTKTRNHGIDPEYVDGLSSLGYKNLTVDALLRARDHGVDPAYIRGMEDLGYKSVPMDALIRMRDHGIDAAYVRRLQQRGVGHLSVDELIERRDRGMDDPDAAARAVVSNVQSLWHSIVTWLRS